jgi:hypothetical protein
MPPIIGTAMRCMTSEPVPVLHMIGGRPAMMAARAPLACMSAMMRARSAAGGNRHEEAFCYCRHSQCRRSDGGPGVRSGQTSSRTAHQGGATEPQRPFPIRCAREPAVSESGPRALCEPVVLLGAPYRHSVTASPAPAGPACRTIPRARMPRALSSAAMARNVVAPPAHSTST